ncbi:glutamate-cysteine ligase family protein [Smaragdicoccus niigatensis]|uniref:glutamate-cysteine ligase family protein n=1 Tax=Smaragdicoccus niigatensis TaxID=359359 RepID=UPI000369586D|nr:glutamate-cysteine ligase family protein [Smaragdicoccus niigatensis]
MGEKVEQRTFTRRDRQQFRAKVRDCLDALGTMLAEGQFEAGEPQVGMEVELNIVGSDMAPAMANERVLSAIADPDFQTELGQFNIEINLPPTPIRGDNLRTVEESLRGSLNAADSKARTVGGHLAIIGMLPTLKQSNFEQQWISTNPRYDLLSEQILAARGEDIELRIAGVALPGSAPEHLNTICETILPEAACTSTQLHLQIAPDQFAAYWNAAQAIAGVQVAISSNSPFLLGRALWHETRIPLFEQATDTRPPELMNQGVRPRVWFGERWITSIFDLFEENSRYFPALLPVCTDEDPREMLSRGEPPSLAELKLHNGTIYRWNRPVYDIANGRHHLRLENRVLPAGPTVVDILADTAFYYGVLRSLVHAEQPIWARMSFDAAADNLRSGAQRGFDSQLYWPDFGWVSPQELVLRKLLPLAHAGLDAYGVDPEVRDRYLGIIEKRCIAQKCGATWQRGAVVAREAAGDTRDQALTAMLRAYMELMHAGEPVHTWTW